MGGRVLEVGGDSKAGDAHARAADDVEGRTIALNSLSIKDVRHLQAHRVAGVSAVRVRGSSAPQLHAGMYVRRVGTGVSRIRASVETGHAQNVSTLEANIKGMGGEVAGEAAGEREDLEVTVALALVVEVVI